MIKPRENTPPKRYIYVCYACVQLRYGRHSSQMRKRSSAKRSVYASHTDTAILRTGRVLFVNMVFRQCDIWQICKSENITCIQHVLKMSSNIFNKLPFNTIYEYSDNYRSISEIKSSIRLESQGCRSPLSASGDTLFAVSTSRIKPRWERTPRCCRGREIHSYPCTWATRSDKDPRKELVHEDKHRGSDYVAKQSARLRLGTSVNHPADPTTNMQRKKLSPSPRRALPAVLGSSRDSSRSMPRTNRR